MDTQVMHLWPRCWQQGLRLTALTLLLALSNPVLAAIPFELDGNAVSATGEDWYTLNMSSYSGPAQARTGVVIDRPEPNQGIFTGGGSKDQQDIPNWAWRNGSPPAKDDLSHAYAAQYIDNGRKILVFGMDRYDTSGDAQLGFWFLQDGVVPTGEGNSGGFDGKHQDGDILVLANFSNGGTVPTIEVYKWENGTTVPQGAGGAVKCDNGIPLGQSFCGITNQDPQLVPTGPGGWTYTPKGSNTASSTFASGAFFEGAVDLGPVATGSCFTNFLAESRSSTSITATLKDFAAHSFPACSVLVTKTCSGGSLSADESSITYTITGQVTNNGGGTLHTVALSDNPPTVNPFQVVDCTNFNPIPGAGNFPLTTLAASGIACYKNTFTVPIAQAGTSDTVTVMANTAAGSTATIHDDESADCPRPPSPDLTIEKNCSSEVAVNGGQVVVKVLAEAEVCNEGDSAVNSVVVTDDHAGTMSGPSTIAKGVCATYTSSYFPTTPDENASGTVPTDPGEVKFTDTATVTARDILNRPIPAVGNPAISDPDTCPLCVCPECNN